MRTSCILKHLFLLRQTTFDPRGRKQSNTTEGIWRAKLLVQIIDCSETVAQLGNKFPQEVPWAVTEVLSCVTQDWAYLFGLNRSAFSFICYFLLIFNGGENVLPTLVDWLVESWSVAWKFCFAITEVTVTHEMRSHWSLWGKLHHHSIWRPKECKIEGKDKHDTRGRRKHWD